VKRETRGGAIEILGNYLLMVFIVVGLICLPLGWEAWKKDLGDWR